mgnify:CR=1 FL=1
MPPQILRERVYAFALECFDEQITARLQDFGRKQQRLIEQGEAQGAPKFMEWYAAFGLLVTLVWLYLEILRLLSKLRER